MKIINPSELSINFLDNGSIRSIEGGPIRISLKEANIFSGSGASVYLRKRSVPMKFTALTGPNSAGRFKVEDDRFIAEGKWDGLEYTCVIVLSVKSMSWQWQFEIKNTSADPVECDLVCVQDVGLKKAVKGPVNEYYVAQYLERLILTDAKFGSVICCRQNMKEMDGHPWLMMASKNGAVSGCTDGMLFFGLSHRETGIPEALTAETLGGEYAGESSIIALQENPFALLPGETHEAAFLFSFVPDHSEITSHKDLKRLPGIFNEFSLQNFPKKTSSFTTPGTNLFNVTALLPAEDLNEEECDRFFGQEKRHIEQVNGNTVSFFYKENSHVVLRSKELLADRPHGHILQAGSGFMPDESIVSTTAFAFGVFNAHLTQGNTNFNTLLSVCTSQFNQARETGQRIIVSFDNCQFLLGVPSAFEMGLNDCRWIYKYGNHVFQVRTWTSKSSPQVNLDFKVLSGSLVGLTITHDFDPMNGWKVKQGDHEKEYVVSPEKGSMISGKFPNARFRMILQQVSDGFKTGGIELTGENDNNNTDSLFVIAVDRTENYAMSFIGEVTSPVNAVKFINADEQFSLDCHQAQSLWQTLSRKLVLNKEQEDILALREIIPWYGMDALIHYLTPYGLEQFGGAAWGTRDVSQGPVELLLTVGKYDEARQVLKTIFSNQNSDGGWPQWWMFDSYREIRAGEAHGDIFYWCILALSNYIKVTGDLRILDEELPYYNYRKPQFEEKTPLREHMERLIRMIVDSFVQGTSLVPFGGGDWNDSLQPVSSDLAQRLISSWTVEMNYQAFTAYKEVYQLDGDFIRADELEKICIKIKNDFNIHLIKDGIVAGYGVVNEKGNIDVLLHPNDKTTGIHYSLLPMERGIISGIFTKEQALHHVELIEKHLKGPDGARLMDKPLKYKGGIQKIFQRAESSTFFGREIGLMYIHEHIRYAELLARMGKADDFVKALRQAIPIGYRELVPQGDIRQANCYYSSSDVAFKNRYEADEKYTAVINGEITLRGGWRVYSSGPGIYVSIILSRLLGLRIENENIIFDPVMPNGFDGLEASLELFDHHVKFIYSVKEENYSPKLILVNGKLISFGHEENKYRKGGAVIRIAEFLSLLNKNENSVEIRL